MFITGKVSEIVAPLGKQLRIYVTVITNTCVPVGSQRR